MRNRDTEQICRSSERTVPLVIYVSGTWAHLQESAPGQALVKRQERRRTLAAATIRSITPPCRNSRFCSRVPSRLGWAAGGGCSSRGLRGLSMPIQGGKLDVKMRGEPVRRLQSLQQVLRWRAAERAVINLRGPAHGLRMAISQVLIFRSPDFHLLVQRFSFPSC